MEVLSGLYMTVKNAGVDVNHVASWQLQPRLDNAKYASNTNGVWKSTTVGAVEWTATVVIYFHDGLQNQQNPFLLGLIYALQFHSDLSGGNYYGGNGRIVDHGDMVFDKNTGDPVSMTVTIEGHGALTANGNVPKLV